MLKKIIPIILLLLVSEPVAASAGISYEYREFRDLIGRQQTVKRPMKTKKPFIGITSHHLPTASPLLDNFYYQLKRVRPDIKTFVIIGPDHFERCRQKFVVADSAVGTMFGSLEIDRKLLAELLKAGPRIENSCFHGEHAIGVEANYIKKIFPKAKIVPMLLSYSAKNRNFSNTVRVLEKNKNDIFVVESTDFTHYVDARKAAVNDGISRKLIESLNGEAFTLKQVDSPGTIKLILQLAKAMKLKPEIIEHKNSFEYDGGFKNTTSYFSVMF